MRRSVILAIIVVAMFAFAMQAQTADQQYPQTPVQNDSNQQYPQTPVQNYPTQDPNQQYPQTPVQNSAPVYN